MINMPRATTATVRLAGIPVHVEWPSLLLGAVIPLYWLTQSPPGSVDRPSGPVLLAVMLVGAAFLALGGLAHEMGHALSARRLGVQPERVRLGFIRRAVVFPGNLPFSLGPRIALLVSLSGPLATLAYAGVWYLARAWFVEAPVLQHLCELLVVVHLCLGYYNLLPIGTNDGRHVVAALAELRPSTGGLGMIALQTSAALTAAAMVLGVLLMRAGIQEGYVVIGLGAAGFSLWAARELLERGSR